MRCESCRAVQGSVACSQHPSAAGASRVELKPTLQNLFDTVSGVCKRAVGLLDGIPRMLPHVIQACSTTYGTVRLFGRLYTECCSVGSLP